MVERRRTFRIPAFCIPTLTSIAAAALCAIAGTASAASDSYTFAGLKWGSSPEAASQTLKSKGFQLGPVVNGPQRELVEQGTWGEFVNIDRGKRLVATGTVAGQKADVQLIFGKNDQLDRVIVSLPEWNGTVPHAEQLTRAATTLTSQLEKQYGATTEKRDFFGWPDTARWQPANDGSRMEMLIRGTHGMMFYPGYKTGVRLNLWNDSIGGGTRPSFGTRPQTVDVSTPTEKPVYKSMSLQ
jgi:hypothetical protein